MFQRRVAVLTSILVIIGTFASSPHLSIGAVPSNDNIESATVLPPSTFQDALNTSEATVEANEPADCFTPTHSVWYKFDSGSDFYNLLADFTGTDFPWRTAYYTGAPGALQLRMCFPDPTVVYFGAVPGETWYIQVSGVSGGSESGNLVFNWTATRTVPIDVTLTLDPIGSVNRSGDTAVVTGMVSCSRSGSIQVSATVTQIFAGRLVATGGGNSDLIECGPTPRPWSTSVFNGSQIRFGPGVATADVSAGICDPEGCGGANLTGKVRLRRK